MSAGRSKAKHLIGEGPPTLNHWEKWRADAGVRGSKQVKQTWGVDKRKRDHAYGRGYAWAIEDQEGYKRWCSGCGDDIIKGEQSVHTLTWTNGSELIDWDTAWHVRCVTPEHWHQLLGQPMADAKKGMPRRITEGVVAEAIEEGRLKLNPLVANYYAEAPEDTVREIVDRLKARR